MKFEIGDTVKRLFCNNGGLDIGQTGKVIEMRVENSNESYRLDKGTGSWHEGARLELVSKTNNITNMQEKFLNLFIEEPEKSYRAIGLLDSKGIITPDGTAIYLTWLLKQDKNFDAAVAQPLITASKTEKNKA